jgi:hypothetical protein
MKTESEIISSLNTYLKALQNMQPLEPSPKSISAEEHTLWMERHARVQQIVRSAELEVEAALPTPIRQMLRRVREASCLLYCAREEEEERVEDFDNPFEADLRNDP